MSGSEGARAAMYAARQARAEKLAARLVELVPRYSPAQLARSVSAHWVEADWQNLALSAGISNPSEETCRMTVARLEEM